MCRLRDNVLAVTGTNAVTLLDVSDTPVVMGEVLTQRSYYGIARIDDENLVVGCCRDVDIASGEPLAARVDVVQADGQWVRTLADSNSLPELKEPCYLCVVGDDVVVSDRSSNRLFRLDLVSGELRQTYAHPDLMAPCQVTVSANKTDVKARKSLWCPSKTKQNCKGVNYKCSRNTILRNFILLY
jgi:hypothetical protein